MPRTSKHSIKDFTTAIKRCLAAEKLYSFDELLKLSQLSEPNLRQSLEKLAVDMRLCDKFKMVSEKKKARAIAPCSSVCVMGSLCDAFDKLHVSMSPRGADDKKQLLSFEELVQITRIHPLVLELSIEKIVNEHMEEWFPQGVDLD